MTGKSNTPQVRSTATKLQELKDSAAFKELSEKFSQAVQDLVKETRLKNLNKNGADLNKFDSKPKTWKTTALNKPSTFLYIF